MAGVAAASAFVAADGLEWGFIVRDAHVYKTATGFVLLLAGATTGALEVSTVAWPDVIWSNREVRSAPVKPTSPVPTSDVQEVPRVSFCKTLFNYHVGCSQ